MGTSKVQAVQPRLKARCFRTETTELKPSWKAEGQMAAFSPSHTVAGQSSREVLVRLLVSEDSALFQHRQNDVFNHLTSFNMIVLVNPTWPYSVSFAGIYKLDVLCESHHFIQAERL